MSSSAPAKPTVWPGTAYPLGATYDGTGTNFSLFSEVADRVAVMYRGKIVTEMPRAEASEDVLGPWMTGARA